MNSSSLSSSPDNDGGDDSWCLDFFSCFVCVASLLQGHVGHLWWWFRTIFLSNIDLQRGCNFKEWSDVNDEMNLKWLFGGKYWRNKVHRMAWGSGGREVNNYTGLFFQYICPPGYNKVCLCHEQIIRAVGFTNSVCAVLCCAGNEFTFKRQCPRARIKSELN